MEIRPKVAFPQQYDEVYYPGRRATHWVGYLIGLAVAAIGTGCIYAPSPDSDPRSMALVGVLVLALGGAALVGTWMVRERTAIALTSEGLYYRDWLNRAWHIPWDNLERVSIREHFRSSEGAIGGTQQEEAYLVGRFAPGGKTTVKVGISSRIRLTETMDIHPDPMISAIITRAGLVPGAARGRERTWVRAKG